MGGAGKEICGIDLSHYHLIQFLVSYYHLMQTRLFVPVEAETEHIACLQMVIVEIFADDISTSQVASHAQNEACHTHLADRWKYPWHWK